MAEIRRAESTDDLVGVFTLRSEVFIGEGIVQGTSGELMFDVFDTIPESAVFAAVDEADSVVGSIRVTRWSNLGFPGDRYFDFRDELPDAGRTASNGSMLCVARSHRRTTIGLAMVRAVCTWSIEQGLTHITTCARPQAVEMISLSGARTVGDEFMHPIEGVPVVPMVASLSADTSPFMRDIHAELDVVDLREPDLDQLRSNP